MTLSIEVEHLTLRYRDVVALDDLTFTLHGGRIYGLLGPNGSGKTSLLSVIAAFRAATGGRVRVDGQAVFENPEITRQICMVAETVRQDWAADRVEDALGVAARLRPLWDTAYAAALVDRFALPLHARVGGLSRGQRSALAVTVGLAARAPVTMFDESYLGLDPPSRHAFYDELVTDFAAHPRTIIIATNLIEEVSTLLDEVVIVDDGRLVVHDDTDRLRSSGAAVTGPAGTVDRFAEGFDVLAVRSLGPTRTAVLYGSLDDARRAQAAASGLEVEPVALQDLFIHLTEPAEGPR